ncbi:unnamed protein product [Prorocentrum cordatum]|uniref:Hexosyltransferase n=1 Tax=Prorocentrum cordatum TaxID=2364126 RepID=A0ABN9WWN3_9DINO|nr:unnamed protein product [Polarella glacialis]
MAWFKSSGTVGRSGTRSHNYSWRDGRRAGPLRGVGMQMPPGMAAPTRYSHLAPSPLMDNDSPQRRRQCRLARWLTGISTAALLGLAVAVAGHAGHARVGNASGLTSLRTNLSVVLYVTTHASDQHMSFLECLPPVLAASPRLSKADVILYVGRENITDDMRRNITVLLDKWPMRNKIVHFGGNPGKQAGAKFAAHVGFSRGWFRGYDWVIRVNPDVVIYDDKLVWSLMERADNWGVFVSCKEHCKDHSGCAPARTHTDFFAVRPSRVPRDAFADWQTSSLHAELQATVAFRDIYAAKADVYLPWYTARGGCRVEGGGVWHSTLVCPDLLARSPWQR